MTNWKRERKIGKKRDSSNVVITKYTVDEQTAREIKKAGPLYGSQGRALQIATEMLIRMEEPPAAQSLASRPTVRVSMRVRKRTHVLIHDLAKSKYNDDPGQVIAACVKVLNMKTIKL
ncbi:MAG TPA: hypothetical protein VNW97_09215 [Candidatus Saccharimonadales bacterium]|jgi:hypothetical protein|nr:hypothetical protein [Candidatus Saccharimonadales bacterium]